MSSMIAESNSHGRHENLEATPMSPLSKGTSEKLTKSTSKRRNRIKNVSAGLEETKAY